MQLIYNIIHIILICGVAPWLIGAGHSMCLSNFHHAVMAGFSMIVFSFPVTFILAVIGWVIWRIFSSEINQLVACFLGLIIGLIMGAMLDRILCDEHHYFFILSGAVGLMAGYIEFYLFKLYNDEIEE